jgi:protein-tyrosine-phosphatase
MAEGGLRRLLEDKKIEGISIISSGTAAATGFPATEYAAEAVKIWKADIERHKSQPLTEELINESDLILTMSPSHCKEVLRIGQNAEHKTFLLKKYPEPGCNGEGVDDPIGGSLDMYNKTFIEIGEELGRIMPYLIDEAEKKNQRESIS